MPLIYLTKEELLDIHKTALLAGGIAGILNEGMLELAVEAPGTIVFGTELHNSLQEKAATVMHEIIKLHPFNDGNKRTAFIATDTFLRVNGYELRVPQQSAVDVALKTAECSMDIPKIADWMRPGLRRRIAE